MRFGSAALLIALVALLAAGAAKAGPLLSATWTQTIQGVEITVTNSGATCTDTNLARVRGAGFITCPTAGLQATGETRLESYSVSLTLPLFKMQLFTTGGTINIATRATLSGAQGILGDVACEQPIGFCRVAQATVTQGIPGTVVVGFAMHTMFSSFTQPAGTLLRIPLSVGRAGRLTDTFPILLQQANGEVYSSKHYITVDFYAWTPGTLTFTMLTSFGMALPDVVAMGTASVHRVHDSHFITLVAPSKIVIDGNLVQRRMASFTTLKLGYLGYAYNTPEPSALLLLGGAALAFLRLRRRS